MIKVQKSVLPPEVATKLKEFGDKYVAARTVADNSREAYRAAKDAGDASKAKALKAKAQSDATRAADIKKNYSIVKKYLVDDFHKKCAYCEQNALGVSAGQTDHVVPVSEDPKLVFEWSNLVLACENCNRNKNAYYDEKLLLLNPLVDEPSKHIFYLGPWLEDRNDERGELTISTLELNHQDLFLIRAERIKRLGHTIKRLKKPPFTTATQLMLLKDLKAEGDPSKEFSLMMKSYVEHMLAAVSVAS